MEQIAEPYIRRRAIRHLEKRLLESSIINLSLKMDKNVNSNYE